MNQEKRIIYADLLRIFATFSVIVLHVSSTDWYTTSVFDFNWQIYNVYDSLVRWCVPVFVMLSGMFFLNPKKEIDTKTIFSKYIFRIVLSLIIWGLVYNSSQLLYRYIFYDKDVSVKDILLMFFKIPIGPAWYHLWYLYMLIGLYVLTPLYRVFIKNATEQQVRYLLILFFLFGLCLPFFKEILLIFDSRLKINFDIPELVNYSGYFFAGYYFSRYEISKKTKLLIYIGGGVSMIFTIIGTSFVSMQKNSPIVLLYDYLLPTTMLEAYMIFNFFKGLESRITIKSCLFSKLSGYTFGIYLVHDFVRLLLKKIGFTPDFINPIFAIPIVSFFVFFLSIFFVHFIKKCKLKYII